jgi:hypothetical protein
MMQGDDILVNRQRPDSFLQQILKVVDRAFTDECHSPRCPILRAHNLDECDDLIAQARKEG